MSSGNEATKFLMEEPARFARQYHFPDSTKEFIKDNFNIRICNKYKEKSKDICVCNKKRSEHGDDDNDNTDNKHWSSEKNTKLIPCDTFGFINFSGYESRLLNTFSKFIRFECLQNFEHDCWENCEQNCLKNCDRACEMSYNLLTQHEPWNLPKPKLIISINGGLKRMKAISNQQKKNFKQGLIEVIKKDRTWILGSGFNVGIHKLVSETINVFRLQQESMKDQVSLIGIGSWGAVQNNTQLMKSKTANSSSSTPDDMFKYENCSKNEKGKVTLGALYDSLLFCDDGTEKQYDKEMKFKLIFENYVKNKTDVCVVQILFEGGRRAIRNAYFSLEENKIPLVVMKGSGRVANIISEIMELPSKNCLENIRNIINDNKELLDIPKGEEGVKEIEEYIDHLFKIYDNYKKEVVIYDMMDTSIRFDMKILEAMIIGAGESLDITLKLCIRFNCPTIASKIVFSVPEYANMDLILIEKFFMDTLENDKSEFVNLFMENNFDIERFINTKRLKELYMVSFMPEKCKCAEMLCDLIGYGRIFFREKNSIDTLNCLSNVNIIIRKLSGNLLKNRYKDLISNNSGVNYDENRDPCLKNVDEDRAFYEENRNGKLILQDLFLWALISGRINLSKILWKSGKDHIASALIASNILRRMATLVLIRGDNNLEKKLMAGSIEYENLAVSIITESYNTSKSKTYTLMVRELKQWNKVTCLDIAINGNMLDFLNHSSCRSYTTKVWMGELSPLLSTWKIILTIPFSLVLMKFLIMPSFPPKKCIKYGYNKIQFQNELESPEKKTTPNSNESKKKTRQNISFVMAMCIFYRSPIVKFLIHLFSYIAFLIIFSYLNLVELKPFEEVNAFKEVFAEMYVYVYVLTFLIEEIRQILDQEILGVGYKVAVYFSSTWNKFDAIIILLFILSILTRFTIDRENFLFCRCLFAVTLSMFYIRTMQFYFVNKSIGPKVIMIGNMLRDIFFFLNIFVIFLLAYGTLAQSLLSPNNTLDLELFKNVIHIPYFQTYGELMLDKLESPGSTNSTIYIVKNGVIFVSFGIFLLLTNILLINLLIAMFGFTFNKIQDDSEKLWCFIRIQLVQEFYEKPIFPPPFNIIYYAFKIITIPCKAIFPKLMFGQENNLLLQSLNYESNLKMSTFEQSCMETAMIELNDQKSGSTENAKETTLFENRLENLERQLGNSK